MEELILKRNCSRNYYHTIGLASNSQARYLVVGQTEHISPIMFHDQEIVFSYEYNSYDVAQKLWQSYKTDLWFFWFGIQELRNED